MTILILYTAIVLLSTTWIVGLVSKQLLITRLRALDPAMWNRLGRPRIFPEWLLGSVAFMKFIWRRQYESLGDTDIARFGRQLRIMAASHAIVAFLVLVYFISTLSTTGKQ